MKALILILLLIDLAFNAQNQVSFHKGKFEDKKTGNSLLYNILYPDSSYLVKGKNQPKIPLILFLHGAGERGTDNERQTMFIRKHITSDMFRKEFPCIVLLPQCPEGQSWVSAEFDLSHFPIRCNFNYSLPASQPLASVKNLVKYLISQGKIDKDRIYIVGLSMGGMGTFEMVHRNPNLFAAAVPICGGGDSLRFTTKARKTDFWIFHGDKDVVVSVAESQKMKVKLEAINANVRYTEYTGVNHDSWVNAFNEPELFNWMFSKVRRSKNSTVRVVYSLPPAKR